MAINSLASRFGSVWVNKNMLEKFSASLSADPLFCLEFLKIASLAKYQPGTCDTRAKTQGGGAGEIFNFWRQFRGRSRAPRLKKNNS